MFALLKRQWFLISLATVFLTGLFAHGWLEEVAENAKLRNGTVAVCMFLMALPLEASTIGRTLSRPGPIVLAVLITFGLLPLAAWLVSFLLSREYAGGLLVAAVTPCTMASAAVWTRKAGGNDTAATVVTVVTNVICFLVTPAWMYLLFGKTDGASFEEFQRGVIQLMQVVVAPIMFAQFLRLAAPVAEFSRRRRHELSLASQCCILFMVLLGAVHTGKSLQSAPFSLDSLGSLLGMIAAVLGLHTAMFWIGLWSAARLSMAREDQIAVAFAGSQKTLMIGMKVSIDAGFSVLPMVTYHIGQLFLDTLLAVRVRIQEKRSEG